VVKAVDFHSADLALIPSDIVININGISESVQSDLLLCLASWQKSFQGFDMPICTLRVIVLKDFFKLN